MCVPNVLPCGSQLNVSNVSSPCASSMCVLCMSSMCVHYLQVCSEVFYVRLQCVFSMCVINACSPSASIMCLQYVCSPHVSLM